MNLAHLCIASATALVPACIAPAVDVVPAGGVYSLEGDVGATESGSVVTSDVESLGLDGEEMGLQPRVDLRWTGMRLSIQALAADFSGDGVTEGTIEIGGKTIPVDARVHTDLGLADLKSTLTWDLVPSDVVELGLGVGIAVLAVDLHMVETNGPGEIDTERSIPVPLAAGRFGLHLGRLGMYAELGYMDISVTEGDLELAEYELGASVDLFGGGSHAAGRLVGGWRGLHTDALIEDDETNVDADLTMAGPFVGFLLTF
jgi:hypothetical protein